MLKTETANKTGKVQEAQKNIQLNVNGCCVVVVHAEVRLLPCWDAVLFCVGKLSKTPGDFLFVFPLPPFPPSTHSEGYGGEETEDDGQGEEDREFIKRKEKGE